MIPYIETHIEDACNLKCRGCSHFSGLAKPRHKDIEEFRAEFKRLSEIEEIGIIRLMGGEPLLNPNFMEYVRIAREYFPNSLIVLVTNGILGDRLLPYIDELKELQIDVTMSDYHIDLQDISLLEKLPYTELHEKGMLYNISLDPSGSRDEVEMFEQCDLHVNQWYFFQDGKMYPCCIAGTIHDFWRHFNLDWGIKPEDLGIDIFTHTAEEIEEYINRPCELCKFCATNVRQGSYAPFEKSHGDISEWTIEHKNVSLIIPVYNLEKYLMPLLISLKFQDLGDYKAEYIFVLNNCTDRSEEIILKSNLYCKIAYCDIQGISPARNTGLQFADGDYIWFVDGDDWLESRTAIKDALDVAYSGDYDMVRIPYRSNDFEYEYFSMVWQYLIKRKFMGNIRFDESKYFGEDLPFSDQLLTKLGKDRKSFKQLPAVSYPLYFYNNGREGSNMQVHDDLVRKGIIPAPVVEYKE